MWFMFLFVAILFFVLTPGVLVTLPPKGSKLVVALVHAIIFAVVLFLIHRNVVHSIDMKTLWIGGHKIEGMTLRECKNKGGRYDAGYCYDSAGKEIH